MQAYVQHALTVFMGLFAIMNPIANTPIFLGLTKGDDAAVRRAVARRALILAFLVILVFCVSGSFLFKMFGIGLPAFQITGGLLVLRIGFNMLQGQSDTAPKGSGPGGAESREGELDKAISPLAMPLLAGPGTIATAMNFSTGDPTNAGTTLAAFGLLCVLTYFSFVYGARLVRYLGRHGMDLITRLMGLILAVIGVQMVIEGVRGLVVAGS
ncbi:MAG: MarC family protein [Acidobacteriota bacterium]|jgi:multiple antibiotic resistance protein